MRRFLCQKIHPYADDGNDPSLGICSDLSPYLHFGQISPLYIVLRIRAARDPGAQEEAFLEQLSVRRELRLSLAEEWSGGPLDSASDQWPNEVRCGADATGITFLLEQPLRPGLPQARGSSHPNGGGGQLRMVPVSWTRSAAVE